MSENLRPCSQTPKQIIALTCECSILKQVLLSLNCTGVLVSPYPDQEGNKLMFLSEWREFTSAPCLAGKKKT